MELLEPVSTVHEGARVYRTFKPSCSTSPKALGKALPGVGFLRKERVNRKVSWRVGNGYGAFLHLLRRKRKENDTKSRWSESGHGVKCQKES